MHSQPSQGEGSNSLFERLVSSTGAGSSSQSDNLQPDPHNLKELSFDAKSEYATVRAALSDDERTQLVLKAISKKDLSGTLPQLDGELALPGLTHPGEVLRDSTGGVRIHAECLNDAVHMQGFVHAQDRFFQMDLTRRKVSGRLAEILGEAGLASDLEYRRLCFERTAKEIYHQLPDWQREILQVYANGVNAGVKSIGRSAEHELLSADPQPWKPEDSVLVLLSMFDALQADGIAAEISRGTLRATLPEELYRFLMPEKTRFDTPLIDSSAESYAPAPIPGPEAVDLRMRPALGRVENLVRVDHPEPGSNAWLVSGARSVHGGAILANDPHLDLTLPGIWHRVELEWSGNVVRGVGSPGNPGVVIGSNRHLAWGFTNTGGDFQDLVVVEVNPKNPHEYRTPEGFERFVEHVEKISVRGRNEPVEVVVRSTRWGVVFGSDHTGRPLALKWTALEPDKINFSHLELNVTRSVDEGLRLADRWFGPSQNLMLADSKGNIGWAITGYLPRRTGNAGEVPTLWTDGKTGWSGTLEGTERPKLQNPSSGVLVTANQRSITPGWWKKIGDNSSLGARAQRIVQLLSEKQRFSEADLHRIQLDSRIAVLDFYRDLLLQSTLGATGDYLRQAREIVSKWNGRADSDQAGVRILNEFRRELHQEILGPLVVACRQLDRRFSYQSRLAEEPVRRILEERPAHLLPPGYQSWEHFLREVLDQTLKKLLAKSPDKGLNAPWGTENYSKIEHPLGRSGSDLHDVLSLSQEPLSGHAHAVRVSKTGFGQTLRMVVSPGNEERGFLEITGGQSGHPLSPHFRDAHRTWIKGQGAPFLQGREVHALMLRPIYAENLAGIELKEANGDLYGSDSGGGFCDAAKRFLFRGLRPFGGWFGTRVEGQLAPRAAAQLPEALERRFAVPDFKVLNVQPPKILDDVMHHTGSLLVDGQLLKFEYFLPRHADKPVPFLVNLPMTERPGLITPALSQEIARRGMACGSIERRNELFRQGETARRLQHELAESVRHQRAFLSYVSEQPGIDGKRLGCLGLSLGGLLGSVLTGVDRRLNCSVLILAGGDLPSILMNTQYDLIREWAKNLKETHGFDDRELRHHLERYFFADPAELARYVETERVLLVTAKYDKIIPRANADLLYERLGRPRRLLVPFGHTSSFVCIDWVLEELVKFGGERFGRL